MQERTEGEKLSGAPIIVALGEVRPLKLKASLKWNKKLVDDIRAVMEPPELPKNRVKDNKGKTDPFAPIPTAPIDDDPWGTRNVAFPRIMFDAVMTYTGWEAAVAERATQESIREAWEAIVELECMRDPFVVMKVMDRLTETMATGVKTTPPKETGSQKE